MRRWVTCVRDTVAAHLSPPVCRPQDKCHPQTIAVCQSRADGLGLKVLVSSEEDFKVDKDVSGILLQYPATDGAVHDYKVSSCCCRGLCYGGAHDDCSRVSGICRQGSKHILQPLVEKNSGFLESWEPVCPAVSNP